MEYLPVVTLWCTENDCSRSKASQLSKPTCSSSTRFCSLVFQEHRSQRTQQHALIHPTSAPRQIFLARLAWAIFSIDVWKAFRGNNPGNLRRVIVRQYQPASRPYFSQGIYFKFCICFAWLLSSYLRSRLCNSKALSSSGQKLKVYKQKRRSERV